MKRERKENKATVCDERRGKEREGRRGEGGEGEGRK